MKSHPTLYPPAEIPSGRVTIDGVEHLIDANGAKVPISVVKPQHLMEDDLVRSEMAHAVSLSDQVSRFLAHFWDNLSAFEELLSERYGSTIGGRKGNRTLMTHDRLCKITVQISETIVFGPELQIAKTLIDECLNDWTEDARAELKVVVTRAFNTDKEGKINRERVIELTRWDISDARWQRGVEAIRDAMRVVGTKSYVRFYRRPAPDAAWEAVTIDLAKA